MLDQALKGRHFLDVAAFAPGELNSLLDAAIELKSKLKAGVPTPVLPGRVLAMVFIKKSTRTRVSFEVGIQQLGGMALFLAGSELQLDHGETIRDTALTLSRYVHAVMVRAVDHADVAEFAQHATVPVINGMSGTSHPCQTMADLLTMREHFGRIQGLKVVFLGAGLNVGTSLMLGCGKLGADFVFCGPEGLEPPADALDEARRFAVESGATLTIVRDPLEAVQGAHIVYTDGWTPPELHDQSEARALAPYRVDAALLSAAGPQVRVMHCLPAHYGEEITEEVVHSPQSIVFDQAENRLHVQKAVLAAVIP